jgi:hypothetical protein
LYASSRMSAEVNEEDASSAALAPASFSSLPVIKPKVVLLVVLIAVDLVLFYRISIVMGKYVIVWSHILYPVLYSLTNAPIFAFQWFSGRVTDETMSYPVSRLATMAVLDQTYQILSAWPLPVLGGAVANVLSLLSLPMNMALAAYFLRRRYGWSHFAGIALCIGASVVQVFPSMIYDNDESVELGSSGSVGSSGLYAVWVAIMVLSALPNAASCVFKEAELKALATLDVWYMNLMIGLWQVVFGALALPLLCFPGSPTHIPMLELPSFVLAGFACALGYSQASGDLCAVDVVPAIVIIAVFLAINSAFSSLALIVFRDESSAVYGVATAASLGLVSILLLFPVVAGPAVLQPSNLDAGAAALAVAGALMYQWIPERTADNEGVGPAAASAPGSAASGAHAVPDSRLLIEDEGSEGPQFAVASVVGTAAFLAAASAGTSSSKRNATSAASPNGRGRGPSHDQGSARVLTAVVSPMRPMISGGACTVPNELEASVKSSPTPAEPSPVAVGVLARDNPAGGTRLRLPT